MRSWQDAEKRRKALKMSRAELARRAGISESTIFKGLQKKTRPIASISRQVELVLALEERVQADDAREQGGRG